MIRKTPKEYTVQIPDYRLQAQEHRNINPVKSRFHSAIQDKYKEHMDINLVKSSEVRIPKHILHII